VRVTLCQQWGFADNHYQLRRALSLSLLRGGETPERLRQEKNATPMSHLDQRPVGVGDGELLIYGEIGKGGGEKSVGTKGNSGSCGKNAVAHV